MSKLMIITRYYSPTRNGLADHSALLVSCLKGEFDSVTVVCEETSNNNNRLECKRDELPDFVYFNNLNFWNVVNSTLHTSKFDYIIIQYVPHMWGRAGIAPLIGLLAIWVRSKYKIPVITYVHELYYDWSVHPKRFVLSLIHRLQLVTLGHASKLLIVTNQHREKLLQKMWPNKVLRIPAGNVSARKPNEYRKQVYPWPYIAWFGTFSDGQRLEDLVQAFCNLGAEFPMHRLVLMGAFDVSCDRARNLVDMCERNGVGSRLVIKGFTDDELVSDLLSGSAANIHINSSGPSGRRGVVAAYLRSCRPIVAIDGKETDPQFVHAKNVLLVPDMNIAALECAIRSVLTDQHLVEQLEDGAKKLFMEEFSDQSITRRLVNAIGNIQ